MLGLCLRHDKGGSLATPLSVLQMVTLPSSENSNRLNITVSQDFFGHKAR